MKAVLGGGELAYDVRGRGPTVLFLHAFPLGMSMWEPQVRGLHESHRVVRFDARGFGDSPPGEGLLSMERVAEDALALLDHLGLAQATVCGLSMGGYAAFALYRRHPERVSALVLADTRAAADSDEAKKGRAELADRVRRQGAEAAAEAFLPKLLGETSRRERPELVTRVREMILANPARGIGDALGGLAARADATGLLREIRVPTLFMVGEEDVVSPPAEMEQMHRQVAGSSFVKLTRAGHLSNMEEPGAFNASLREFLRSRP
ncbi:MAG TPA: alpha/beta fold hydrolase [Vicinamibacteria bacterium]|nr:alpha/beta fold hydrolase [Vicinamibacteria bacterium]